MYYSWSPQLKRLNNRCLRARHPASPPPARDGAATPSSPPPQLSKMIEPEDDAGVLSSAMAMSNVRTAQPGLQHDPTEPEAEPPESRRLPGGHPPGPIDARWDGTGIVAAAEGTVFGTMSASINYRGRLQWEPEVCEECDGPLVRGRYERICPSCYSIIAVQLWRFLVDILAERPAARIWGGLREPEPGDNVPLRVRHPLEHSGDAVLGPRSQRAREDADKASGESRCPAAL